MLLQRALREIGLENPVHILPEGQQVLLYLEGKGKYGDRSKYPFPSVMFLDIKMPKANGFDVLKWLRAPEGSVVPAIILSTSDEEKDVKLAYELCANGYFVKPRSFDDLKAMLKAAYEYWRWCTKPVVPWGVV